MPPKPIRATAAAIVRLFHYDPNTGVLSYRNTLVEAGYVHEGRRMVGVKGQYVATHRLIWLYCYGYLPLVEIDHMDGDKSNNRLSNLRLCVEGGFNSHNQYRAHSNNKSGLLGVRRRTDPSRTKPYHAGIRVGGVHHFLGEFYTAQEAHVAYVQAKRELHKYGML